MLVILKISLVLKWMTYPSEKVLCLNFFKRREYSDFIARQAKRRYFFN